MHIICNHIRLLGLCCAALTIGIGITYFQIGGAPLQYSVINLAAFIPGALLLVFIKPNKWSRAVSGAVVIFSGMLLTIVAIWGVKLYGASRWLAVGRLYFEPAMICLPLSAVLFAKSQNVLSAAGIIITAIAVAMQPDRSMAAALFFGLLAILAWATGKT